MLGARVGVDVPEENSGIEALEEFGDPVIIGVKLVWPLFTLIS